jgi:arylsulfatase A-like enzyme
LAGHAPLTHKELSLINHDFRLRAQDMKSVDNMIGNLVATLKSTGAWSDTCFVFSSDNGLHMGEHRLTPGKLTAFDTDIHVPLIVVGPGVHPDSTVAPFAENIDLRPTFDALAGTKPSEPVDGRSLLPLLSMAPGAQAPAGWPQGILVEHHGPDTNKADPDYTGASAGNPPSYEALRMSSSLYVVYDNGQHEYYNLKTDPYELDNIYSTLSPRLATALADEVHTLENCHDSPKCSDVTVPST